METVAPPTTTIRTLPEPEWEKLLAFEPWKSTGLPQGPHWRILVAEQQDRIVGFCCLFDAVHFEPWYIEPDQRGNPAVVRGLLRESGRILREADVSYVFATVPRSADGPPNAAYEHMLARLGFRSAPGVLYLLQTDALSEM